MSPLLWVSKFLPVLLQGQGDGVFSQVMQWESLSAWESIDTSTAQSKEGLEAVQSFHVLVSIDANPLDHSRVLEKETAKTQRSTMDSRLHLHGLLQFLQECWQLADRRTD